LKGGSQKWSELGGGPEEFSKGGNVGGGGDERGKAPTKQAA